MNAEGLLQHYHRIADTSDALHRLRQLIFALAVRGKLAPQSLKDDSVLELKARLIAEKSRIGKAAKLDPRPDPEISDALVPIPKSWSWIPLFDLGRLSGGMTPSMNRHEYWDGNIVWLSPKDIKADEVSNSELKITEAGLAETRLEAYPPGSLFIVARSGILKRTLPVAINRVSAAANQDLKVLVPYVRGMERYLQIMFRGLEPLILRHLVKTGTTVQSLKYAEFESQPFPIPPLAEQRRIVTKVDELLALCDQLEKARADREAKRDKLTAATLARLNKTNRETFRNDARFALDNLQALTTRPDQIKRIRQTVLNLAVQGKLAGQDPNDPPASQFLNRVFQERAELVRAKAIRPEPPLPPIEEDEWPLILPRGWVLARIGDAVLFTQYGTSQKSTASRAGVPVLTMGNIQNGSVVCGEEKTIPEDAEDLPALYLENRDILYNRTNSAELVGKTGIYLGESGTRTFASYLIRLRPSLLWTNPRYINLAMNAPVFRESQIVPLIKKQTGQANVNGTALKNMVIPLPPLPEQERIVTRVDELMSLFDELERTLSAGESARSVLLEHLLTKALEPPVGDDIPRQMDESTMDSQLERKRLANG